MLFRETSFQVYEGVNCLCDENLSAGEPFSNEHFIDKLKVAISGKAISALYYESSLYTLVPQSVFKLHAAESYFKLNFGEIPAGHAIAFDQLHGLNLVVVYVIPNWLERLKREQFSVIPLKHVITQILNRIRHKANSNFYGIELGKNYNIIAFQENKLLICNAYTVSSTEDLLYYSLLTFKNVMQKNANQLVFYPLTMNEETLKSSVNSINDWSNIPTSFHSSQQFILDLLCV